MTANGSIFRWFDSQADLIRFADSLRPQLETIEADISGRERLQGYCMACDTATSFIVGSGVMLGNRPNLREGMLCANCGLSNRNRLVFAAVREAVPGPGSGAVAILEQLSPLFARLKSVLPHIVGSEYVAIDAEPGSGQTIGTTAVRHESILCLSYATGSLDTICHNDVLEHVFEFRRGLNECRRVLSSEGKLIFTCPFLMYLDGISVRATRLPNGVIDHHGAPEYHGDPLHPEGTLAFYHFGWQLLEACRDAGFRRAECGVLYDPYLGFLSSNHPDWSYGAMLPVIFRAIA